MFNKTTAFLSAVPDDPAVENFKEKCDEDESNF